MLTIILGTTQSVQELAQSGVMADSLFYNVIPKKCIQPLWAYALIVVGLTQYHTLAGQMAHILYSAFGDQYKNGSIEMSANAFIFYMKDWATMLEILTNPNFFMDKFCMLDIDRLSPMVLYLVNSKGFYIPWPNFSPGALHDLSAEMHFTHLTEKMNEVQCNVDSMSDEAGRSMK